ncbi:hypothetical protein ACEPAG_4551 [Sanghuangporus baumii]
MGVVQSAIGTEATGAAAAVGALVAGTATAYAMYKRVVPGVEKTITAAVATGSTDKSTAEKTTAGSGSKKSKGRKKKAAGAAGNTSAPGVPTSGAGGGGEKSDADAELDELLRRAKAEADAERARAEARRVSTSKGLIPGAFDAEQARDLDVASNAGLSSDVEGKGGARERKRKKGKKAAITGGGGGSDKKEAAPAPTVSTSASTKPTETPAGPTGANGTSKKSKKRKGTSKAVEPSAAPLPPETSLSAAKTGTSKPSNASSSSHSSQALAVSLTLSDAPEDASWTRVSTRKKAALSSSQQQGGKKQQIGSVPGAAGQTDAELLTSDTNLTTSGVTDPENNTEEEEEDGDGGSVREPENRRTFAERMLPRPRKTGVEDLEDEPLQPTLARVMRIKPAAGEKPAKGFSWGDYEEYAHADDGTSADGDADDAWEQVKSKKRTNRPASALTSSVDSLSYSSAPARAPITKKQRQNAERHEAARLEKEAAERERLERLAQHRRELERVRIAEQFKNAGSGGSKKNVSGGMKASVEDGKLVWDY